MVWGLLLGSLVLVAPPALSVETLLSTPPHWLEGAELSQEQGALVVTLADGVVLSEADYDHTLAALLSAIDRKSEKIKHIEVRSHQGHRYRPPAFDAAQIEVLKTRWLANRVREPLQLRSGSVAGALAGKRIVLSAGHGINWYEDEGRWRFQRGELHALREDIHCNQIVAHHLAPMLEAAGADVVLVRERSSYANRIVIDNDPEGTSTGAYGELGAWQDGSGTGRSGSYRVAPVRVDGESRASWTFSVSEARELPVYVWFQGGGNRARQARFEVDHAGGTTVVYVDQTRDSQRWRYLGTFGFAPGLPSSVHLSNRGSEPDVYVIADSVRLGGGAGFVDYGTGPSGQMRWRQSAKSHAVEEEVPEEIRAGRGDVSIRPSVALWQGADLYFALHTNAGGGRGTSSFVYSDAVAYPSFDPNRATEVPPGTLALQEAVHARVIESLRANWKSDWSDRGIWGANFGELRPIAQAWRADPSVSVPAMLIEVAFHDSAEDAVFLREERFRRDVARAVMQGMIEFMHSGQDGPAPMTPPLPPTHLHLSESPSGLWIQWEPQADVLHPRAEAEHYLVELSVNGATFGPPRLTTDTKLNLTGLVNCESLAVRVRAVNTGGHSQPSKVLIARVREGGPKVLWVHGVRRTVRTVLEGPEAPQHGAWMLEDLRAVARSDLHIESTEAVEVASGEVALEGYDLVIWSAGETSTRDKSLSEGERHALQGYLEQGGALMLSGAELGWDLVAHGDEESRRFFSDVLQASYVADAAETSVVEPGPGSLLLDAFDSAWIDDGTYGRYRVEYPDALDVLGTGHAELFYESGEVAALSAEGPGKVWLAGFPLETLLPDAARVAALDSIIDTFVGLERENLEACGLPFREPVQPTGEDTTAAWAATERPAELLSAAAPHSDSAAEDTLGDTGGQTDGGSGCGASAGPGWLLVLLALGRHKTSRGRDKKIPESSHP